VKLEEIIEVKRLLDDGNDPLMNHSGICPFQVGLQGQNQDFVRLLAKSICQDFKKYAASFCPYCLYRVWIGYVPYGHNAHKDISNIRIIALINMYPGRILPEKYKNITIHWQLKNAVSEEARTTSDAEDIDTNYPSIVAEDFEWLFYIHTNLNIIHPSSYRSFQFSNEEQGIEKKPCLALYCLNKGYIPLCEMVFPKMIAGRTTDVREGFCNFAGGEIGTGIVSNNSKLFGTIGGFIRNPLNAFITAAHVVADKEILKYKIEQQRDYLNSNKILICTENDCDKPIGEVICWCLDHGDNNRAGVDAALVQVYDSALSTENMLSSEDKTSWTAAGILYSLCSYQ